MPSAQAGKARSHAQAATPTGGDRMVYPCPLTENPMYIQTLFALTWRLLALALALAACLGCGSKAAELKAFLEPKEPSNCGIAYILDGTASISRDLNLKFVFPEKAIEIALAEGGSVQVTAFEVNTTKGGLPRELGPWSWKLQTRRNAARARREEVESIKQAIASKLRTAQTSLATPVPPYQTYLAQALDSAAASVRGAQSKFIYLTSDLFEVSGRENLARTRLTPGVNFEVQIPTYNMWASVLKDSGWLAEGSLKGVEVTAMMPGPSLLIPGPKGSRHDPVEVRAVEALWGQACSKAGGTFTTVQATRQ